MNSISQNQLVTSIGCRMNTFGKHTMRSGIEPSKEFKQKIASVARIKKQLFRKVIIKYA